MSRARPLSIGASYAPVYLRASIVKLVVTDDVGEEPFTYAEGRLMSTTSKLLAIAVITAASVGLSKSPASATESARHMCTGSCTADPGCSVSGVSCTDNPDGTVTVDCKFKCAAT
jgi:hypothetical protein